MTKLIIGAFPDRKEANEAVLELEEADVPQEDLSVIGQEGAAKDTTLKGKRNESAAGMTVGGIVGALVGLGIPEERARYHASVINSGGVLLGVEDNEASEQEIRQCFEGHGAEQITVIEHGHMPARATTAFPE